MLTNELSPLLNAILKTKDETKRAQALQNLANRLEQEKDSNAKKQETAEAFSKYYKAQPTILTISKIEDSLKANDLIMKEFRGKLKFDQQCRVYEITLILGVLKLLIDKMTPTMQSVSTTNSNGSTFLAFQQLSALYQELQAKVIEKDSKIEKEVKQQSDTSSSASKTQENKGIKDLPSAPSLNTQLSQIEGLCQSSLLRPDMIAGLKDCKKKLETGIFGTKTDGPTFDTIQSLGKLVESLLTIPRHSRSRSGSGSRSRGASNDSTSASSSSSSNPSSSSTSVTNTSANANANTSTGTSTKVSASASTSLSDQRKFEVRQPPTSPFLTTKSSETTPRITTSSSNNNVGLTGSPMNKDGSNQSNQSNQKGNPGNNHSATESFRHHSRSPSANPDNIAARFAALQASTATGTSTSAGASASANTNANTSGTSGSTAMAGSSHTVGTVGTVYAALDPLKRMRAQSSGQPSSAQVTPIKSPSNTSSSTSNTTSSTSTSSATGLPASKSIASDGQIVDLDPKPNHRRFKSQGNWS